MWSSCNILYLPLHQSHWYQKEERWRTEITLVHSHFGKYLTFQLHALTLNIFNLSTCQWVCETIKSLLRDKVTRDVQLKFCKVAISCALTFETRTSFDTLLKTEAWVLRKNNWLVLIRLLYISCASSFRVDRCTINYSNYS